MKSLAIPIAGAGLVLLLAAGAVAAASPAPIAPAATTTPAATTAPAATTVPAATPAPAPATDSGTIAAILGLTDAQVMGLRHQGLSLAQIAEQQKVDPQRLVDALAAQWSARIDARLAVGALTADQATTLKANVAVQAKAMVYQVTMGGMRGAAVGAGPNGAMRGMGGGTGMGAGGGMGAGAGRGGMMRGAAAGNGTCPMASPTPSS